MASRRSGTGRSPAREATSEDEAADQQLRQRERDTADYVADLAAQLAVLARSARLDILAYLLDIARLEARSASEKLALDSRPATRAEVQ